MQCRSRFVVRGSNIYISCGICVVHNFVPKNSSDKETIGHFVREVDTKSPGVNRNTGWPFARGLEGAPPK